jgi:hypothetical protein
MKKILISLALVCVFSVYARDETDAAMAETVAARMKSKGEMHVQSTLGIQPTSNGGGISYPSLGAQSGRLVKDSISGPTSNPERMQDRIFTGLGGITSELYSSGDISGQTEVGTPAYDAKKLDLGTGGIIPSHSTFAPEYMLDRLQQ